MINIILVNANNKVSLLYDFNCVNLFRLMKTVSTRILSRYKLSTKPDLIPHANSANIDIVKNLNEFFKLDPKSAALLAQCCPIALFDFILMG